MEKFGKKIPINSKTTPLRISDVRIKNIDCYGINDKLALFIKRG